jgi:hypothetical protein
MEAGWKLHFIRISGMRMIKLRIDGLSRGDLLPGVMDGKRLLPMVP